MAASEDAGDSVGPCCARLGGLCPLWDYSSALPSLGDAPSLGKGKRGCRWQDPCGTPDPEVILYRLRGVVWGAVAPKPVDPRLRWFPQPRTKVISWRSDLILGVGDS